ncbi:WD40-repeat-containing domain protein [Dunaliella salina]|uniref:WD40-repeat-containing domain protein n=1 Tax=Dunaliella salina TaxID=3046 RepID=A0ABQ7GHG2_DUNSA|nr:WD40-repeat-containing domain protein [Dunaliella salina]|eukprot:KAF5834048.1 WD40-repeat-containing domain protein [Dunaliella salina]
MEIYYCNQIKKKTGATAAWSQAPGYAPMLAVSLAPNAVGLYTEEGQPWDPKKEALVVNVRSTECAKMAWHPLLPLLAIGWRDGGISFYNVEERRLEEDSKTHRRPVTHMMWSANGERLITTDEHGKLAMWKTDRQMRPLHVNSYEEAPGSTIGVATMGPAPVNESLGTTSCVVFYGVNVQDTTVLKWANDQGQQGVMEEMPECATDLIYYAARDQLLVVGVSCTLYLLGRVDQDSPWYPVTEMRFSSGTGEAALKLQVCWAAEHTLATASGKDGVVRMYNFETEDNYVIQVESAEGTPSQSPIVCLKSDLRYGMLAAGSADGRVSVFNYHAHGAHDHPGHAAELSKSWDAQPAFLVEGPPQLIQWGPNSRLMCVVCDDPKHTYGPTAVSVCRKTLLHQCYRDGYVVIQSGVDQVLVEQLDAANARPPAKLTLGLQLQGLDMSDRSLLVYGDKKACVYEVSSTGALNQASSFETPSQAMAISKDSIFRAADNIIEVCNTSGGGVLLVCAPQLLWCTGLACC